ncbi:unnamed protein product [Didymodactylos carnosus]|uniref:AN1-type domain-containing protein n=1 Tax=Didymodactylos carnosus TaxID=1234261 RepID=A0A813TEV0_9BILA|nr:unnamed protein product [Didymodactylos carnosus]CAF0811622.1 unnamed protein product [Didymodactylos carnosus]CAF3527328.1 unnamed protein product [Didymodactylos carnosus]CAF3597276.1 unnamed protein product [Didymodactylos carnosus]
MEFPHLGKNCSVQTCNRLDFLPMKCDACEKIFCKDHIRYNEHKCESSHRKDVQVPICPLCGQAVSCSRNEEPDQVVSAHIDRDCKSDPALNRRRIYTNRCSAPNCKQREAIRLNCDKCLKTYCLKHRFPEDHKCNGYENTGKQMNKAGAAAIDRMKSSTTNTNVISSIHPTSASSHVNKNKSGNTNNNAAASAVALDDDSDGSLAMAIKMSIEETGTQQDEDYLLAKALQESEEEEARRRRAQILELDWKRTGRRLSPMNTSTNVVNVPVTIVNSNSQHPATRPDDQKTTNEVEEFDNEHDNTLTNKKTTISSFRSVVGKPSRTTVKKVDMNTIIADLNRQQGEDKKVRNQMTTQTTS